MRVFNKKIKEIPDDKKNSAIENEEMKIQTRPRICCIDINNEDIKKLKNSGFNIYEGTLGNKIKVPNYSQREYHLLLLNFNFPPNLHEYDIVIIDLENGQTVDYKPEDHIRKSHTGKSALSLLSSYPETIFDPRPLCCKLLNNNLKQIGERFHIIIVFTAEYYEIEYQTVEIKEHSTERQGTEKHNIYSFLDNVPLSKPRIGKEMTLCNMRDDLKNLLESNLSKSFYNQTFHHPAIWENDKRIPKPNYIPLLKNTNGEIVSICAFLDSYSVFYFPQIQKKGDFLNLFLTNIAPDLSPEIFPFSTTFCWKKNEEYFLPNHKELIDERRKVEIEYEEKLKSKDSEISTNIKKYSFLHDIITETGDILVDSIAIYLKWLFPNARFLFLYRNPYKAYLTERLEIGMTDGLKNLYLPPKNLDKYGETS